MSITTQAFRLALSAAALCAAVSSADAKPRRVVILDFDGPRQLADSGRSSVLTALGQQYDVVATKRWESARAAAAQQTHGPAQWSKAAKQAGVDAVIEGWVQDEGRRKILNVVVREASNGKEFDTITVRFDGKAGMSGDSARQLATSLDEVLDWIDEGQNETPPAVIPTFDARKATRAGGDDDGGGGGGGGGKVRVRHPVIDEDGDGNTRVRGRHGTLADDEAPRRRRDDDEPRREDRAPAAASVKAEVKLGTTSDEPADGGETVADGHEAKPVEVSVATRDASAMEKIFPQDTIEHKEVFGEASVHVPQPTKRFMIDAGGYYGSRSLTWSADPDANVQQFAGVSSRGVQINAAIYPWPTKAKDGILSGIGFTGELHHSLGSSVISDEEDTINEYVINQNGFELGAHYRAALNGLVALDGGVFYGNQTYEIVDASPAFETPDTKYSYLGAGVHLDLAITDHAQVGFGARYFTVLDSGDLQSTDFFGPAQASGLGLEGSFVIPLPANLYVRGQIAYQRIALELSGGGVIADEEGVTEGKDSTVVGNVNVGISF
jgi:hypothetical protein